MRPRLQRCGTNMPPTTATGCSLMRWPTWLVGPEGGKNSESKIVKRNTRALRTSVLGIRCRPLGSPQHDPFLWPYTVYMRFVYRWYVSRVRTNIEIEDTHLRIIMNRYAVHTKTEAVDLALRHLAGLPMTRDEALAMRGTGAIGEIPADAGPSEW
jgi:Arc/MetJ family transcription regulator